MIRTPVSKLGLPMYDGLEAAEAVYKAWNERGRYPSWHEARQHELRQSMPLLGKALDRLRKPSTKLMGKIRAFAETFEAVPPIPEHVEETTEEAYDRGFARGHNAALAALKEVLS